MTLRDELMQQFEKAQKEIEKSNEMKELIQKHKNKNEEIRKRNLAAIKKLDSGQEVTEQENEEIRTLGNEQERIFRELSDKI